MFKGTLSYGVMCQYSSFEPVPFMQLNILLKSLQIIAHLSLHVAPILSYMELSFAMIVTSIFHYVSPFGDNNFKIVRRSTLLREAILGFLVVELEKKGQEENLLQHLGDARHTTIIQTPSQRTDQGSVPQFPQLAEQQKYCDETIT